MTDKPLTTEQMVEEMYRVVKLQAQLNANLSARVEALERRQTDTAVVIKDLQNRSI